MGAVTLDQFVDQRGGGHVIAKERHRGITAVAWIMVGENTQSATGFHGRQRLFDALAVGGDKYGASAFAGRLDHGIHQRGRVWLVHDQGLVPAALVAHIQVADFPAALVQ